MKHATSPRKIPNKVILLVDDDADIREAITQILEDEGYHVIAVQNGREALDYLQGGGNPCIILLDLMMPVMDGWQFAAEKQSDPALAPIPVVVITAAMEKDRAGIQAERVISKPLKIEKLLGAVETYC